MNNETLIRMAALPRFELREWHTPASLLPRVECQDYRIHQIRYTPGWYDFYGMGGFGFYEAVKSLPITELQEKRGSRWYTWMVDDPPHWYGMQRYAKTAHGKVLMGGLGLGLALRAYLDSPRVKGITVVDRAKPVLALLDTAPAMAALNGEVNNFVLGDVLEVARDHAKQGVVYDHVLLDLWVANGEAEKEWLLMTEVGPMVEEIQGLWPSADIIVHGFWRYSRAAKLHLPTADFHRLMPGAVVRHTGDV